MLRLKQLRLPYSYRYFNVSNPYVKQLLPGWAPEFTLKDYKVIIVVEGAFFGNIPSVISQNILAKTILEREGWRFLIWHEYDIKTDLDKLFRAVPEFKNPTKFGGEYPNPHAKSLPAIMEKFYFMLSRRHYYISANPEVRNFGTSRRRRRRFVPGYSLNRQVRRATRARRPRGRP